MIARHVGYESLLMTNRAVVRRGNWLRIHTAGDGPEKYWLEFDAKSTAKRAGSSILNHVREKRAAGKCNTDYMYNRLLFDWFNQLHDGGYIKNLPREGSENEQSLNG